QVVRRSARISAARKLGAIGMTVRLKPDTAAATVRLKPDTTAVTRSCLGSVRLQPDRDPRDQPQREADEEDVEHRFLQQAVEENGRRIERQHQPGHYAGPSTGLSAVLSLSKDGAPRKQSRRGEAEQRARRRADDRLDDADEQEAPAPDRVDDAEQIRIQRRL